MGSASNGGEHVAVYPENLLSRVLCLFGVLLAPVQGYKLERKPRET